jgi:hypothetical protein
MMYCIGTSHDFLRPNFFTNRESTTGALEKNLTVFTKIMKLTSLETSYHKSLRQKGQKANENVP